jgi:hypothetical protein
VTPAAVSESVPAPRAEAPKKKVDPESELALLGQQWTNIVNRAGRVTVMARSCFIDARPLRVEGDHVVIGFDPEFEENLVNARTPRIAQTIERIIAKILGRTVSVDYTLLEDETPVPVAMPVESPTAEMHERSDPESQPVDEDGQQDDESLLKDPAVKNVLQAFEGRVVEIRR